jgi:hypothetical protein
MKRYQVYGAALLTVVGIWMRLKIVYNDAPTGSKEKWVVDVMPWYFLICFGCYCLTKLGWDLLTFNDYPKEIGKLEEDIRAAEADLKRRGFTPS